MSAPPRRLYLLGDKTLSGMERALNELLAQQDLPWRAVDAGFDSWLRVPMDPAAEPLQDTAAALGFVLSPRILERPDAGRQDVALLLDRLASLSPPRTVLCSNLFPDPTGAMPLVRNPDLLRAAARLNETLYAFSAAHSWFHVVDHAGLALREGTRALSDPRFEATAQMYFSPAGGRKVAQCWLRVLRALARPAAKVMVVDLDNTLWRGILGEDGADALEMGASGPGWAHRQLQQALLQLKANGILLAVCSKNNPDEALEVLAEHPDCLLRPADFSGLEIGWQPKADALRALAARLRLGLDSFVFLDDSPFEREQVRQSLPEVTVLDFPDDPTALVARLSEHHAFDTLRITDEDRQRSASYAAEAQREELQRSSVSPETFFRSLDLKLRLFRAEAPHFDRLHQLIHKTNQFNLTAARLSPEEFRAAFDRADTWVIGMRVSDRYGDSGVCGLAIVNGIGTDTFIVSLFLLSCRVIGRTVENGFLSWLVAQAAAAGVKSVRFAFKPTSRNSVALEFLQRSGLRDGDEGRLWATAVPPGEPGLTPHFVAIEQQGFPSQGE